MAFNPFYNSQSSIQDPKVAAMLWYAAASANKRGSLGPLGAAQRPGKTTPARGGPANAQQLQAAWDAFHAPPKPQQPPQKGKALNPNVDPTNPLAGPGKGRNAQAAADSLKQQQVQQAQNVQRFTQAAQQNQHNQDIMRYTMAANRNNWQNQGLDSWLRQGAELAGDNPDENEINLLRTAAMKESGGNPGSQNNWDSNAAKGTPSKGLMQTIPSTFGANAVPGYGDIYNPIHNTAAAIRYAKGKYGARWLSAMAYGANPAVGGGY